MLAERMLGDSDGLPWPWEIHAFGSGKLFWLVGGLLVLFPTIFGQFQIAFPSLIQV